ncbi:hypothetical protein [Burkholderia sp. PAMC 26561]|jgi:hypothetical protein|uniref:hypothetical protein n=1 Tax=Burkholderia sp. PAMC 26561 TaxID=1795043 RepID=UPI00076AFC9E|nr:hypothetical protein [Burkholderia sp. PAMC 26561]AME24197.1 hypothetical protein AXG89_10395 [Burkholderia sp. PAMC 26561]
MALNHPKRSIVIDFSAEDARLLVYPVEREKTQSIIANALEIPILFDEAASRVGDRYQLDDEFARRFGVAMLNLLALSYPDLKQDITASQAPIARE